MAQPTDFSNAPSVNSIAQQRKLAQALAGQAMDTSPVGHWTQALARAVQGGVSGLQTSQAETGEKTRQNAILEALKGSGTMGGLGAADQSLLANNPEMLQSVATKAIGNKMDPMAGLNRQLAEAKLKNLQSGGEQPSNIREWNVFNRMSPDDQQRYLTMKRAEKYLDTQTGFVRPNPLNPSAPPTPVVQKDIIGRERQEKIGQAQGAAATDFPRIVDNAVNALKTIEQIERHPGTPYALGVGSLATVPGTTQADAVALIEQVQGKAFLEAFNSLKGGGQITEAEGKKATDAIARLSRRQSREGFSEALRDLKGVILTGVERARRNAASGGSAPAPARFKIPDGWKIEVE